MYIAPPPSLSLSTVPLAWLLVKLQFSAEPLYIAPPLFLATLPSKVQFIAFASYNAPPFEEVARLFLNCASA